MSEPRYGIWAPVRGNFVPLHTPDEPIDDSYERTRELIYFPSAFGFKSTSSQCCSVKNFKLELGLGKRLLGLS